MSICAVGGGNSVRRVWFGQVKILLNSFHPKKCKGHGSRLDLENNKKLSYRRGTARCVVSVEILPIATQQCGNYLYDKS